jgi:2'-5' RNA ligase
MQNSEINPPQINPSSEKTSGYHLFLMPGGKVAEELTGVMEILANTFQGDTFAPHVTLLARIPADSFGGLREEEIREKCAHLASELSPFPIMLAGIGAEKSFFRALYLKVVNPDAVSGVHVSALGLFSMKDAEPYVPHLSLAYGNFPEEVIAEMKECAQTFISSDTISFTADRIYLCRTEGAASEWKLIAEFPFDA